MVVNLEHRYFGHSKPFGNASATNENLKFLTLDNVMADAVEFVSQMQKNFTWAAKSKAVAASGGNVWN